jgi:hypothetical protein
MTPSRGLHCLLGLMLVCSARTVVAAGAAPDSVVHVRVNARDAASQLDDDEHPARDDVPPASALRSPGRAPGPAAAHTVGANVRMNSLIGSPAGNGEAEVSIAAIGSRLISAWNDGKTFATQPGFVGYGYSSTGGQVWFDGGSLPVVNTQDIYYGDPVMASDPAGHWYVADLYRPVPGTTGISVNHGVFTGSAPVWDAPVVLASSPSNLLDKPWVAVDPASGAVYCAWVRFAVGQQIEFARSLDHGVTWSAPVVLAGPDSLAPMSPRLTVGPNGEVDLAYYVTSYPMNAQLFRVRRSVDHGVSWGPEHTVGGRPYNNNYYSGPAGFNRERVVALVSTAIDRSAGLHRGRLHAVWHEMVDADADALGTGPVVSEVEPDDIGTSAVPFTPGASLRGSLSSTTDQDWWSFTGVAGQTLVAQLSQNGSSADGFLRAFAGGSDVANRCAYSHFSGGFGVVVFTLPSSGTYRLRVLNFDGVAAHVGAYRIDTAWHTPTANDHARDHRDVMYSNSDNAGVSWSTPVVLSDAPPGYDETFPEVAVDNGGRVYVMWYDHREDAANGILTSMRARISPDGGANWIASERVDDAAPVNWNLVASNMFPNMGDYSQLVSDGSAVHAVWADGRDGTPDVYYSRITNLGLDVPPSARGNLVLACLGPATGGVVRVRLTDPGSGEVRLELFDVLGRRLEARTEPGQGAPHDVDLGHGLSPGIYLVRAISGSLEATNRAVVLQ